jgi:hypothetical protein
MLIVFKMSALSRTLIIIILSASSHYRTFEVYSFVSKTSGVASQTEVETLKI